MRQSRCHSFPVNPPLRDARILDPEVIGDRFVVSQPHPLLPSIGTDSSSTESHMPLPEPQSRCSARRRRASGSLIELRRRMASPTWSLATVGHRPRGRRRCEAARWPPRRTRVRSYDYAAISSLCRPVIKCGGRSGSTAAPDACADPRLSAACRSSRRVDAAASSAVPGNLHRVNRWVESLTAL